MVMRYGYAPIIDEEIQLTITYRAVFFDMDGTLLDTLEDLAAAINGALAEHDLPGHPRQAVQGFVGAGMPTLVRRALPGDRRGDEQLNAAVLEATRRVYRGCWADNTRPYPGVPGLLDALADRGLHMAILSNKPHDFARDMAERFLGTQPFSQVRGVLPGGPLKPDPAAALEMAASLKLAPEQVVFVGDSPTDVETALAAGMQPVGVSWGFRGSRALSSAGAEVVLDRPEELLSLRLQHR